MSNEICVLGDSVAKGVVLDSERGRYRFSDNGFVQILERENGLHINNYAKFGCTVPTAQEILQKHEAEIAQARFCVVELGGNDSDFEWGEVAKAPESEHLPRTPIEKFINCYTQVIGRIRELGSTPIIINLPPIDSSKYFNWISRGADGEHILEWLGGSDTYIYRWHEMYSTQICRISNKLGVAMVDIRSAFLKLRDYTKLLCEDGIHPNEEGYRLIAGTIAGVAAPMLHE